MWQQMPVEQIAWDRTHVTDNPLHEEEKQTLCYMVDVLKGLACSAPGELQRRKVRPPGVLDVAEWATCRRQACDLWKNYLDGLRSRMRGMSMTNIPDRSSLVAVMIEMRQHEDLDVILRKAMSELDQGTWALVIVCSRKNADFVHRCCDGWSFVHIRCLDVEGLDGMAYADFRRSELLLEIIEEVGGKTALFLECDSVLLRPGVENFLNFDLVGAPWSWALLQGESFCVGNGGVSLRTVAFMRAARRHMAANRWGHVPLTWARRHEDICFARAAAELRAHVPDVATAASFSVETVFHPAPVACHKPWQYLLPSDLSDLLEC